MVDSALRSSRRMSRLVADLLLLARADAGRLGAHRRCDLAEIAGDAAAEVAPLMGDRELRDRQRAAAAGRGQPRRAAPDGPQPARQRRPPHARRARRSSCACARDGGEAVVEVADDGPGIPPSMRDQIFDRFVRGDGPADTAVGPGSGLGLAIVRAVAASHGGTRRGRRVRLPAAPSSASASAAAASV